METSNRAFNTDGIAPKNPDFALAVFLYKKEHTGNLEFVVGNAGYMVNNLLNFCLQELRKVSLDRYFIQKGKGGLENLLIIFFFITIFAIMVSSIKSAAPFIYVKFLIINIPFVNSFGEKHHLISPNHLNHA